MKDRELRGFPVALDGRPGVINRICRDGTVCVLFVQRPDDPPHIRRIKYRVPLKRLGLA